MSRNQAGPSEESASPASAPGESTDDSTLHRPAQGTGQVGALGGAANEDGSEYRACVGALLASALLRQEALHEIKLSDLAEVPTVLAAEGDEPVDDLKVHTASGARIFVQAKRSAGLTSGARTPFGKAMAQFARALDGGLNERDRLVLAYGKPKSTLAALGRALDRYRLTSQGSPSSDEARALSAFERIAASLLDADGVAVLKRHLIIWPVDPSHGDGAMALAARLEGPVAKPGGGSQTARALADTVRDLARRRAGHDSAGLVAALLERKAPLTTDPDPRGPVADAQALVAHRRRMVLAGKTLRLLGVQGGLSGLPFESADCEVKVDVDDQDRAFGRSVEGAVRRRGRVLVIGSAGAGKSTSLRILAAHWASRNDWPTPLLVHLQQLARSDRGISATLIDAAAADVVGDERTALRKALGHELTSGRCLVLLDGLDEVREGRAALLERLAEWLDQIHPDNEIVIAARPIAAEAAGGLALAELSLRAPDDPDATVGAILSAAAHAISESGRSAWIDQRRRWVDEVMRRDEALKATPLMVVVIAVEAASRADLSTIPTSRAGVLRRALEQVIDAWELERRRRGSISLGPLTGKRAANALADGLQRLSRELLESRSPSGTAALAGLSEHLAAHFGLPAGDARATAEETLAFWEEAGLVQLDRDLLTAPIRVFAEVGYAWWASEADATAQQAWVIQCRGNQTLWPTLALAAGLSPAIREAWVTSHLAEGSGPELCALIKGHEEGALLDSRHLSELVEVAIARDLTSDDAEDVAWELVKLDLSQRQRDRLRPHLAAGLAADRSVIVEAWVTVRWDEHGPEADGRLRAILEASPHPPERGDDGPRVIRLPKLDNHYYAALQAASLRLAGSSRSDAERVVARLNDGTLELRARLPAQLRAAGHSDLAEAASEKLAFQMPATAWDSDDFEFLKRFLLETTQALGAPAELSVRQRRRLDELSDFMRSVAAEWIYPWWPKKRPEDVRSYFRAMAKLTGFEAAVISAQAQLVAAECDAGENTDDLIEDGGTVRDPDQWQLLDDQRAGLEALVQVLGTAPDQVMVRAAMAIAASPTELEAYRLVEARAERLRKGWDFWFASRLLAVCAPDGEDRVHSWIVDPNPLRRQVAAEVYGRSWAARQENLDELQQLLADPDEGVREAAISELEDAAQVSAELRAQLTELRQGPRMPWRCRWCGTDNGADESGCGKCSHAAPSTRHAVAKILDREGRRAGPSRNS